MPVRVVPPFANYRAEVEYIIGVNAERRQLTKGEVAFAYRRLKELPRAEGGTKGQRGGDHGNQHTGGKRQSGANTTLPESRGRDAAAELLGVNTNEARALEKVFCTPGVPDELKRAVNKGTVARAFEVRITTPPARVHHSSRGMLIQPFDSSKRCTTSHRS